MNSTNRRDQQMRRTDLMFGFLGAAGLAILIHRGIVSAGQTSASMGPVLTASLSIGLVAVAALFFVRTADLERRCNEDYRWQLMAQSAFIAALTVITFNGLAEDFLLGRWLGEPSGHATVGVLVGSWALAYFVARIRGAAQ